MENVEWGGGREGPGFDEVMGENEGVDGAELEGGANGEGPIWRLEEWCSGVLSRRRRSQLLFRGGGEEIGKERE